MTNHKITLKIGILTQPSRFDGQSYVSQQKQYIVSSYIKYLQQHNYTQDQFQVKCVPIPFDAPKKSLESLFQSLDGLFFTGGMMDLQKNRAPLPEMKFQGFNIFLKSAQFLFELAKKSNDNGRYFPIWGTCQGFQMMQILVNDNKHSTLTGINDELSVYNTVEFNNNNCQVKSFLDKKLVEHIQEHSEVFYYHYWSVTRKTYEESEKLRNFFQVTAYSRNSEGVEFVAAIEGKKYPFFGIQFHSEIPQFEQDKLSYLNTRENYQLGYELALFFLEKVLISNQQKQQQQQQQFQALEIDLDEQSELVPELQFSEIVFFQNEEILRTVQEEQLKLQQQFFVNNNNNSQEQMVLFRLLQQFNNYYINNQNQQKQQQYKQQKYFEIQQQMQSLKIPSQKLQCGCCGCC